ncbi:hypothetical protein D3C84_826650 [compost metagenome]
MAQPRRFDEQPIRPRLTQQAPEPDLERRAIHATQTAPGHFTQCYTFDVPGQQCSIEADLAKFVDQHRPTFVRRSLRQQVPDQAGLAGAQRAGDDVGRDVLQHGRYFSEVVKNAVDGIGVAVGTRFRRSVGPSMCGT